MRTCYADSVDEARKHVLLFFTVNAIFYIAIFYILIGSYQWEAGDYEQQRI